MIKLIVFDPNSVCVLPELGYNGDINNCHGICSDYVLKYERKKI